MGHFLYGFGYRHFAFRKESKMPVLHKKLHRKQVDNLFSM